MFEETFSPCIQMSEISSMCLEHTRRIESVENILLENTKQLKILSDTSKRIEFGLFGDEEMEVDGLAKSHKKVKGKVECLEKEKWVQRGFAMGAGAVGGFILKFLRFGE